MKQYKVTTPFFYGEKYIEIGTIYNEEMIKNNTDLSGFVEEIVNSDDADEPAEEEPAPEVVETTLKAEEPAEAKTEEIAVNIAEVVDETTAEEPTEAEEIEEIEEIEEVETISDEERIMKLEAISTLEEVLEAKSKTDGNNLERIENEGITDEMLRRVAPTGKGGGYLKADLEKLLGRDI